MTEHDETKDQNSPGLTSAFKVSRRDVLRVGGVAAGGVIIGGLAGYQAASLRGGDKPIATWKLGTVLPKHSPYLGQGQEIARGLELGVAVINGRGGLAGRKVELVTEEVSDLSAESMDAAAKALLAQEPIAVFLGFTSTGASELATYKGYGAPVFHVSPSEAARAFSAGEDSNIFRGLPQGTYGPAFAGLLRSLAVAGELTALPATCLTVVPAGADGEALAASVENSVTAGGWTVLDRLTPEAGTAATAPVLEAIRSQAPGVVFLALESPSDAAAFQAAFVKEPSRSLIYHAFSPSVPEYLAQAGESANGVVWSSPIGTITESSTSARFEELFAKKNRKAQLGLSQAGAMFDLSLFWAQCAVLAKRPSKFSSVGKVVPEVVFRGVSGSLNFGDDRVALGYPTDTNDPGLGLPHLTFQIQDGKHVRLAPGIYRKGAFAQPVWL